MKSLTYSLDSVLSDKYLELIIEFLEPKIFNEKFDVLFYKIKKSELNINFLIEYLRFFTLHGRFISN